MAIRLLGLLLTAGFYSAALFGVALVVYPDVTRAVEVEVVPDEAPFLVRSDSPGAQAMLAHLEGDLVLDSPLPWLFRGFLFVSVCVALYLLHQLRAVVRSVDAGEPFREDNVRRMRRSGWLSLLAPPLLAVAGHQIVRRAVSGLEVEGARIDAPYEVSGSFLVAALLFFVMAEVFRHGLERNREAAVYRQGLEVAGRARKEQESVPPPGRPDGAPPRS